MNIGESDRLWKLQTRANSLVLEGKREVGPLFEFFQRFVYGSDLGVELWRETYTVLEMEDEYREAAKQLVWPDEDKSLWFVPMAKGATSSKIVAGHRKFGVNYWLWTNDLDAAVPSHDRDANRDGSYIVGFHRNVEADKEFVNKSAILLAAIRHRGICLPERLMLGAGYHVATGQHLDVESWTMCTGSRSGSGDVPCVDFISGVGRVLVSGYDPGFSSGSLRSRSAVFLPTEASGAQPQ